LKTKKAEKVKKLKKRGGEVGSLRTGTGVQIDLPPIAN
jgi:hypothetical protein